MNHRTYGGFWRRLLAYLIDRFLLHVVFSFFLLLGLSAMALGGVSAWETVLSGHFARRMCPFAALYAATILLVNVVYFVWFHGTVGQTLGKRLCGLRLVRTGGREMTLGTAFLRWVGSLVSGLSLFLGFLWIGLDERKQGWHDKIAATLVIRTMTAPADLDPMTTPNPQAVQPTGGVQPPSPLASSSTVIAERSLPAGENCLDKQ